MYLDADAVDSTFSLIRGLSGEGSRVVFDYIYSSVLRDEERYFGERELLKNVRDAGEPWTFGFEEGKVGGYLRERGFKVLEECDTEALERKFFTDGDGVLRGRINGTHSIVLAELV
jgi:O-methyltransferase involved in polyketide biosynthesis